MDIFQFSLQMERDAEALYRNLAERTEHKGVKNVFTMLADDENRHARAIEIIKKNVIPVPESSVDSIITVFRKIQEEGKTDVIGSGIIPELNRALEIEKKGMEFYEDKLGSLDSDDARKLFSLLSRQEKSHYHIIENLIELIEKPEWWVEHAEFTPKGDDYY